MADNVAELADEGAAPAPAERSGLIDLLLVSLHEGPLDEVAAVWHAEVDRRLAACDRGETPSIDGAKVLAEARRLAR